MPHIKQQRALLLLVALMLLFCQALLGLPLQLRSSSSALNHWAVAFALVAMPFLAMYGAPALPSHWHRRVVSYAAAVLAVPTLLLAGCTALLAPAFGQSDDFQQISEGQAGLITYRLYRTDCGATCAHGLVLRKELDLVMGLTLVTPVWSMYRASDGSVSVGDSAVRITRGSSVLAEIAR